jgi:hypothetical protein
LRRISADCEGVGWECPRRSGCPVLVGENADRASASVRGSNPGRPLPERCNRRAGRPWARGSSFCEFHPGTLKTTAGGRSNSVFRFPLSVSRPPTDKKSLRKRLSHEPARVVARTARVCQAPGSARYCLAAPRTQASEFQQTANRNTKRYTTWA